MSGDVHGLFLKGGGDTSLTIMDDLSEIKLTASGNAGLALGMGTPDFLPIGLDDEGSIGYRPSANVGFKNGKFVKETSFNRWGGKREITANIGTGFMLEGGGGADVSVDINRREINVDLYLNGSNSIHFPANTGQIGVKLGIEPKASIYYTRFERHTFGY